MDGLDGTGGIGGTGVTAVLSVLSVALLNAGALRSGSGLVGVAVFFLKKLNISCLCFFLRSGTVVSWTILRLLKGSALETPRPATQCLKKSKLNVLARGSCFLEV